MPGRNTTTENEGEGGKTADRAYREKARQFVDEGLVEDAAITARIALDTSEGARLREAEGAAKARSAGEDPELYRRAEPAWWTREHASAWERIKAALYRDWLQTKADLGLDSGVELGQSAGDTVKQAAGKQPMQESLAWARAEMALRFGYGAAAHYGDAGELDEDRMRAEWEGMTGTEASTWEEARPLVRRGWEARMDELRASRPRSSND
jgi:hypothetical protein